MIDQNRLKRFGMVLFFLLLIMLVIHTETLIRFNRRVINIHGNDASGVAYMEIDARADSTSTWLKRSFQMDDGREVDLIGQTIDGTLYNQSGDAVRDWELRINITQDCYINQAWNGEVEIHQFVGTDREKVQRMNLQNYQLEDVTFEYRYDGDLLIPLQRGDYVIYYPSTRFGEMPIDGGDDAKIGVIFYYLDELDLSDYDLQLRFHRAFTQGFTFYAFVGLALLWLLTMTLSGVGMLAYRRAMKEMELRKSGISSMSDIYDLIYVIHLPTGEMTPVSVVEKIERDRPKNQTAKELLTGLIMKDTEEKYRDRMLEFTDTGTLAERLKDRDSIVCEFQSLQYGWCAIRFFAMDRVQGKPLENVVLAVQNINDEKKEQEAITHQIEEAESLSKAKATFIDSEAAIQGYARSAQGAARRLLMLTDGLVDSFGLESGKLRPASQAYSLRQLLIDTLRIARSLTEENRLELALDAAEALPDGLQGDPRMLREVLANLVSGSLHGVNSGKLQLSVYGKPLDGTIHLLFSVRVLSDSANTGNSSGLGVEVASTLLTGMGSALKTVHAPAGRGEVYFEIEQKVLDPAPIGKLSIEDAVA